MGNKRKGSSTVFLALVLASMIALTIAFVGLSIRTSAKAVGQSVCSLGARSLLSEYNRHLLQDYGLFAMTQFPEDLAEDLSDYANTAVINSPYYHLGKLQVSTSEYNLSNPKVMEKAILDDAVTYMADLLHETVQNIGGNENSSMEDGQNTGNRVLRNNQIIADLPSSFYQSHDNLLERIREGLDSWEEAFVSTGNNFLVNQYILTRFNDAYHSQENHESFFQNEVEYILHGHYSDRKNLQSFRNSVLVLRNIVNVAFLLADPQKRSLLIAAAETLTPGPVGILTLVALAEAWALAESENDMQILEHGKKVPFEKTPANWATDLDAVLNGNPQGYIEPKTDTGLDYRGYLQVFLFFEEKSTKMTRIMDLIQINMQGSHDAKFLIREYQVGIRYKGKINGITIEGDSQY